MTAAEEFIDAALWHGSLDRAEAILAAHPEIASSDIYTAAVLGDDVAVRRFLALDPASATAKGGPRSWDALTYLCFSKYLRLDPARSDAFVRAATALLDAGASPNAGFFEGEHQPKPEFESVLYGAAGVAHHPGLTQLLLDRGADPNDGEVAYHTAETLDNRAMKILVESGKLTPLTIGTFLVRKFDWHNDDGVAWLLDHGADPNLLTHWNGRPFHHALLRDNPLSFFEMLLDHGADPTLPDQRGTTPLTLAVRRARVDVLDLCERRGFAIALQGDDAFLAACARADAATARRMMAEDPSLISRLQSQHPALFIDFAGTRNLAAVRLLLDLGFDPGSARSEPRWARGETALHVAAGRGDLPLANLLIERGAPLEAVRHGNATALTVALRCLIQQSEWTPNEFTLPIARALLAAGARIEPAELTLAAAFCLDRAEDMARLAQQATAEDLHLALEAVTLNGLSAAIAPLIALGVDLNAYNARMFNNATVLHNAVSSGSLETVQTLVAAGADIEAKDRDYQATPLNWAEFYSRERKDRKYADIVAWLKGR